jgi:uncharacterized protein (DUF2384 family)
VTPAVKVSAMSQDERESLARVKRELRLIQRSIDVLGSTPTAYHWLTTPCAALRGKAPRDIRYDMEGARRVSAALRRRALRQRKVRSAGFGSSEDGAALTAWLWKKCRALGDRRPAMLLALSSSPMVEDALAFLAASRYRVGLIVIMSIIFAISTIARYVGLSVASTSVLQRFNLGPVEPIWRGDQRINHRSPWPGFLVHPLRARRCTSGAF